METAQARAEAALRRDATLEAVAFAAQSFLDDADWERSVPQVLRRLGEATEVSRVYLMRNAIGADRDVRVTQVREWCAAGVPSLMGHPTVTEASWRKDGFDRWAKILGRGDVIHGPVRDFPEAERAEFELQGVRSLVVVPVFAGPQWWGLIGFDAIRDERVWSQVEIDALRAAAGSLGAAIRRTEAEERLRETESRLRDLVENIPAVTFREAIDANPERFYISPQVERLFGYTPHEWTWTPGFWLDHIHPEDAEAVAAADRVTNETGQPFAAEYRFRHADGSYIWIQEGASLVGSEQDERFWQGFMLDITERKEAEAALAEAEARYRALVEQVPVVIYTQVIDPDDPSKTITVYISPHTERMLGYTAEETLATGGLWREILHPDDRDRVLDADARGNQTGEDFVMEYRMMARDGRVVWVHDEATAVRQEDGRPRFWQGFMLEITERKQAEERLERALEVEREAGRRLRSLDEMKNTFLQAVSHDLRTPLAAILGLAVTLERAEIDLSQDDAQDLAHRIAANARKLDRMVTDLLDLDRLSRGIVEPKLHPTDVGALVSRIVADSELTTQRRITLEAPEVVVNVDAAKVERIVENLLANTLRHTPAGTPVRVEVLPRDGGVLVVVEDTGPGISTEMREAVFEPFRQGAGAADHSPGVGVGLTLVRRFAELHGGRAWAEEREGGGASFRVFLPDAPDAVPFAKGEGAEGSEG